MQTVLYEALQNSGRKDVMSYRPLFSVSQNLHKQLLATRDVMAYNKI